MTLTVAELDPIETADPTATLDDIVSPTLPALAAVLLAMPGRLPISILMSFVELVIPFDSVNAPVFPAIEETDPADEIDETDAFFHAPDAS